MQREQSVERGGVLHVVPDRTQRRRTDLLGLVEQADSQAVNRRRAGVRGGGGERGQG